MSRSGGSERRIDPEDVEAIAVGAGILGTGGGIGASTVSFEELRGEEELRVMT